MIGKVGKFDDKKKARYLGMLRSGVRRGEAAHAAGVSRECIRLHMKADKAFQDAAEEAEQDACDAVENALWQKALSGNVPAIMHWLTNRSPDRWKARRSEPQNINITTPQPSIEDMRAELQKLVAEHEASSG